MTAEQLRNLAATNAAVMVLHDDALVLADALEIADYCARADIECNCPWVGLGPDRQYDTTPREDVSPEENAMVAHSVRYLMARGHLVCDGALVRFTVDPT